MIEGIILKGLLEICCGSFEDVKTAWQNGADRVELYTEAYASGYEGGRENAVRPYVVAAERARECGLDVNAGHDLSLVNLEYFIRSIPWTAEVSIGHAIICDALYMGLEKTIHEYLSKIKIF